MSVSLRHPTTGELKVQPEGRSWGCFLGSFLLGLPLFRRGLVVWGSVMVVFNTVALVAQFVPTDRATAVYQGMVVIGAGLCLFFGLRANRMAIDRYLEHGWEFADPRQKCSDPCSSFPRTRGSRPRGSVGCPGPPLSRG
jgi:hypothetical protein